MTTLPLWLSLSSACQRERTDEQGSVQHSNELEAVDGRESRVRDLKLAGCSTRKDGRSWCLMDFFRLASMPHLFDGETIYLTGFLAIDGGSLVLYSSEEDFQYRQPWRSLRIRGSANQIEAIAQGHLYQYVRLEGSFDSNDRADIESGRLGSMLPPVSVREAEVDDRRQSVDEIRIDARDLEAN